jgi:hypothetical protein
MQMSMLKFLKKYELRWKVVAVIVWMFSAAWKFISIDENGNKNFQLFIGIVWALLGVFYLFEVIDLIRKKKLNEGVKN